MNATPVLDRAIVGAKAKEKVLKLRELYTSLHQPQYVVFR